MRNGSNRYRPNVTSVSPATVVTLCTVLQIPAIASTRVNPTE